MYSEHWITFAFSGLFCALLVGVTSWIVRHRGSVTTPARRVHEALRALAIVILAVLVVRHSIAHESLKHDALWTAVFVAMAWLSFFVAGSLGIRALLGVKVREAIDDDNMATAIAAGGHQVAMAILIGNAVNGSSVTDLWESGVFLGLGLVAQQGAVALYRAWTTFDDAEQISGDNIAAAFSWVGFSIGAALIVARALQGSTEEWSDAFFGFTEVAAFAFMLIPVRQWFTSTLFFGARPSLRGGALDRAIAEEHDATAGLLDAIVSFSLAFGLYMLF